MGQIRWCKDDSDGRSYYGPLDNGNQETLKSNNKGWNVKGSIGWIIWSSVMSLTTWWTQNFKVRSTDVIVNVEEVNPKANNGPSSWCLVRLAAHYYCCCLSPLCTGIREGYLQWAEFRTLVTSTYCKYRLRVRAYKYIQVRVSWLRNLTPAKHESHELLGQFWDFSITRNQFQWPFGDLNTRTHNTIVLVIKPHNAQAASDNRTTHGHGWRTDSAC